MNSYDIYTRTQKFNIKYKIKLNTCTRSHANKNKHKNDNRFLIVNVLDSKCPFRMLEMAFQSIKISKLSGEAGPHPLAAHAPLALASFIDDWKTSRFYILKRLDSLLSSWLNFSPWPLKMHFKPTFSLSPKASGKISPNWKVGNPPS